MNKFKAALFDLDGTLMDTEGQYTIFWGNTARKYRPDIPDLEYKIKGMTLVQIYATYFPDKKVQEEITRGLDEWEANMNYEFLPGALDFIRDIKAHGVRCAIVTSSNTPKMNSVARKVPDFNTLFDHILTAEDFSASKPAPDCYLLGASVFGCDLDECVVFEDACNGLMAGMSSGIYTIGVTTTFSREEIQDKCHYAIDDFEGLDYDKVEMLLANK